MGVREYTSKLVDKVGRRESGPGFSLHASEQTVVGYLFALPYMVLFGVFLGAPLLLGLYMSFHDWNALAPAQSEFIGLGNYRRLLGDPLFWKALFNTVYFVILTVPPLVVGGLLLALGVNRDIKGRWVLRTIFFSPYILTVSVIGLTWTEIFGAEGLVPYHLSFVLGEEISWLSSHLLAMPAVAIATIWWTVAFNFIILLAGRQSVPEELYEAAKLDGARTWRLFRDITLPQMKNPILFTVIITTIASFQIFGQPYIMTSGGPAFSTHTLVMYIYSTAFETREFGYGAAVGYVFFLVLLVVSFINYRYFGGDE